MDQFRQVKWLAFLVIKMFENISESPIDGRKDDRRQRLVELKAKMWTFLNMVRKKR